MQTNNSLRIRTKVNEDSYVSVKLDHNYETLEILSLKIDQKELYRYHVSDYGILVGRVLANNGFGVPNARLSLFIPKNETTSIVKELLYPYDTTLSKNEEGIRYNLLPDRQRDDCHQVVGTFPNKRVVLDDNTMLEIFSTYYKYTTRTNESGDYMFFGIPTGTYTLHMDLDISDCGKLSQRPRDFVYKGYTIEQFENANQFKVDTELSSLPQIFTQDVTVDVKPFWGDSNEKVQIGISRQDIDVAFKFEPTCVFMGSIVTDNHTVGISTKCVPAKRMGDMNALTTGQGRIEIIRKKIDNTIEELQIKGTQLIDGNGVWCFQIPMNLDYVMTDEYGNTVPTDNPEKGIPTRCEVRFRLSLDEESVDSLRYHRGKVLVPHNPQNEREVDYHFGSRTMDSSFKSLMWNNVYTIKSFIPRFQKSSFTLSDKFTGIKKVNIHGSNNPMPYNNIRIEMPFMFRLICALVKMIVRIIGYINLFKRGVMAVVGNLADITLTYSYISNELCPDLDNWYFAPHMKTTPSSNNNRTCRQWENQSVCGTYKEIAADMSPVSINGGVTYYSLISAGNTDAIDTEHIFNNRTSETTVRICEGSEWKDSKAYVLTETITADEHNKLEQIDVIVKFYEDSEDGSEIISKEKEVKLPKYNLKKLYKEGGSSSYNSIDENSIDSKNAVDKPDGVINLTTNTDYLMQCIEINLAQQYEVIKFDFYNDWINGCVYLPRWARDVKYKRRRKKGETIITEIPKMCINDVTKSRIARRYVQQCAVMYEENGGIKTDSDCGAKKRCHKKDKMTYISVLGSHSGVVNESITSRGDKVYYLKPCEFHDGNVVNFFATDIVMLGTLFDCNEYGLPSTFSSLVSTSYQMPPQLAETNVDDEASIYSNNVSAPTPREIKEWKCNSKCNKGGKMVMSKVNTNGVQKQLVTSYSDLEAIVSGLSASDDKKVKYYRFSYNLNDGGNNTKDVKEIEAQSLFYSYRDDTTNEWSDIQCIIDEETKNEVAVFYDEDYKYYVTEENKEKVKLTVSSDTISQDGIKYYQVLIEEKITIITSLYRTVDGNPEPFVLEYEDLFPVTETAGVDWGYEGVGYVDKNGDNYTTNNPSGHFLGLSCWNAETIVKSCVNLQRACEIGTSLSTRIDIPVNYNDEKVEYMYIAPNGFIGKDQITDATFRSAFATMNQNSLKTKLNAYGYKEYDFTYLLPDSFDGSYSRDESVSVYTKLKDEDDAYLGDFNKRELKEKIGDDVEISSGRTFIRDSEIQSKDYINFRFGGSPKFLNRVPIFKNSFYFYFGLKDGSTALDEFRKQFYAPCAKNVIVEERGSLSVNVVKKTVYEAETKDMGEFIITPIINGLDYPFTYELQYLDKEGEFQVWDGEKDKWKSKKIDVLKRGKLISQENTIEVYPGNYELVVTDYKGNTISKTFNVGVDFFKCDYDLTSVTNFKEKFETNDSNWKKSRDKKKGEIGGYINGSFSTIGDMGDGYIDNNKGDGQKLIVPVIKKDEKDEKEVARYIHDKETNSLLWNRFFSSKKGQFCVWDDGTYEIWVRYYEKNDKNIKQPIYQYKLDEFVINNYEELIYFIGDRYILDSSVLKELNTKYGEWWEMSDTNSFKNVEDEKTNYFLYKNLVSGEDFNANKSFGIKVSGDIIGFKQEESTTGGLTNRYEVIEGGNINVQYLDGDINTSISRNPIYMIAYENLGDGEFKFSTLSLKNVEIKNGYVVKKDEYEYEFETFKKYLNRFESDNIKDNYCLFKQTEGDGKRLVKVRAVGNRIKVDSYENTNRSINGNGSLVILDQILPIRMEKRLDCLITVNNSSSAGIQRKIMPTSRCFNNKFDIPSLNFIFGSNGIYMKYTDSAEKTYMDEPQYNIVNIRLKNGYFLSNGVKFENGKFIPTYNGNVNILTNANLNTTNTSVEYLVVPKNISGDELFEDEVTRSMNNENISFRDDKDFIEKITFKKETDNKEKIVIINILR